MPTATLTLTSADIAGDPVNVSKTSTCYKAGTENPLDQTAGLNKIILTTTTNKELYIATAGGDNVAIGKDALGSVAVGENSNVAIGTYAMRSMDEGTAGGDINGYIAI